MRRILVPARVGAPPGEDADAVAHEFRATTTLAADELVAAVLHIGGVATSYDVVLNGDVVASGTSMFERHRVPVVVCEGENEVVVVVHPLTDLLDRMPSRPRARWRTMLTDEPRLRWVRTTILGRAPGFAPGPPVVGPWRPIVLETGSGPRVTDLRLQTSVLDGVGVLDVELAATGGESLMVEVHGPGASAFQTSTVPESGTTLRFELPDIARWWPHTHGEPVLYDVTVSHRGTDLPLPGDGTLESTVRRVGFRSIENVSPSSVALEVNDVMVFVRGAVWTPGDLAALDEAVALGLNLVRVSGLATYESDAFHARCDELGLLVWHDLMFATYDYPTSEPGFRDAVLAEVAGELERLVAHPSIAVVCGSAEHEQQASMFGVPLHGGAAAELGEQLEAVVARSGVDAVWVPSTPAGGTPPTRVDVGVAQYFGVGAYLRDLPDIRASRVGFAGECLAFANLPDDLTEDLVATREGVPRDNGAHWDFADVREHYAAQGLTTGALMATVFGEWRRPDSGCGGGIVLWLRDLRPGAGWGLLDHAGATKPAARELAPALQPLAVWLVDEGFSGIDVHVANDGPAPVAGVLRVELLRPDDTVQELAETPVLLAPHGHAVRGVEEVLGRFADASFAYRFGPAAHAAVRATLVLDDATRVATWRVRSASAR